MTRQRRSWIDATQLPMLIVVLIAAAGVARVATANWREGAVLLGGSLLVAAALRIFVPEERAGLLVIRSRPVDVLCYVALGMVVVGLAVTITRNPLSFG